MALALTLVVLILSQVHRVVRHQRDLVIRQVEVLRVLRAQRIRQVLRVLHAQRIRLVRHQVLHAQRIRLVLVHHALVLLVVVGVLAVLVEVLVVLVEVLVVQVEVLAVDSVYWEALFFSFICH